MDTADVDGDGVMSVVEATSFLVANGRLQQDEAGSSGIVPHRIAEWYSAMDSDGNGFISLGELDSDEA